jgi:2-polyprenyl-3-methyl-5-hydroxy-6-metoxy-1,4-benzoquinol methylase
MMKPQTIQSPTQSNVINKEIEDLYGKNYLKWKGWEQNSSFASLKKQEKAYFAAEIKKTRSIFSAKSKVLEIGFGNGSFLKYALDKKWDIYGTEINEHLVKAALECGFNVCQTDNLLVYSESTFDLVVAFDVLEHISQNDLPNFIGEIKRILKNGGCFIARFPNGDSPFGLADQNGDVTHITTIGSGKAYYFAAQCDMEVVFVGGESQPLFGTSLLHFAKRLFALLIKKSLHFITNLIFFPRSNISFYSSNLIMIYKKSN